MASFQGYTGTYTHICGVIRHNERTNETYSNKDINVGKSNNNYFLSPEREVSPSQYFKQKLDQCWYYDRKDVKKLDEWIISMPRDLDPSREHEFFQNCYDFLNNRYCGEDAVVLAVVHKDESGQPHLHYDFVPIVRNTNPKHRADFKICNKEVVSRKDLRSFHDDLQAFLDSKGMNCTVHSGITRQLGQKLNVHQLKVIRDLQKEFTPEQLQRIIPVLNEEYHHNPALAIKEKQQEHDIFQDNREQDQEEVWDYSPSHDDIEIEQDEEWF